MSPTPAGPLAGPGLALAGPWLAAPSMCCLASGSRPREQRASGFVPGDSGRSIIRGAARS